MPLECKILAVVLRANKTRHRSWVPSHCQLVTQLKLFSWNSVLLVFENFGRREFWKWTHAWIGNIYILEKVCWLSGGHQARARKVFLATLRNPLLLFSTFMTRGALKDPGSRCRRGMSAWRLILKGGRVAANLGCVMRQSSRRADGGVEGSAFAGLEARAQSHCTCRWNNNYLGSLANQQNLGSGCWQALLR